MGEVPIEYDPDSRLDQVPRNAARTLLLSLILQLKLARHCRLRRINVADSRDHRLLAGKQLPSFSIRHNIFEQGNRQPLADPGPLIDTLVLPSLERYLLD